MPQIKDQGKGYRSIVLVGNKSHEPNRQVTEEEGKQLAEEFGITFFKTSA